MRTGVSDGAGYIATGIVRGLKPPVSLCTAMTARSYRGSEVRMEEIVYISLGETRANTAERQVGSLRMGDARIYHKNEFIPSLKR